MKKADLKSPIPGRLTLVSWNVNGIRAAAGKGLAGFLSGTSPDVACLQETKASPEQFPPGLASSDGYRSYFHSAERKGYSGTAVFSKIEPVEAWMGLGDARFDVEGRAMFLRYPGFTLVNVYVPNGRSDLSRVPFKLDFSDALLDACERRRRRGEGVIVCGDFNTAHREIDLARPAENRGSTGFLPEERAWLDKFTASGYADTFRVFHPGTEGAYTWWDQRTRARPRNVGWRLDYFFASGEIAGKVKSAFILDKVLGSDHCPVGIELCI